jgi:hypothetical protein
MMRRGIFFWIVLLSALALVAGAGAQAGDPVVIWNRTYGEPGTYDAAYAIVPGPGGIGFFLAGETASPADGKTDALVVRLAPDGSEEWNRTYGGEEADAAHSIIRTGGGNLLFAGNLTFVTNGTEADTDAWLMEIDPSGEEVWNRTYGGADDNATATAVIEAEGGGYVVVGSIAPREGNGSSAWVARVNETGDEAWNRTFGGAGENAANAVTRLPGGDYVVVGSTESSGAGMADVWVVRLDGSGNEIWNRTFGSPDDDAGRAVINTSEGNLVVAGTFTERPDNTTVDTDALLIKFTPDGDTLWNWIYGDFGVNETAGAVIETADGGYLFAGETAYSGVADTDAWLVATNAGGAVAWSRTFGGENPDDKAASLIEVVPGEYVFAGQFNATERVGPANLDAWAVRLGKEPMPTPTPTATPTPAPTTAPSKPPKAPIISRAPPVTTDTATAIPTPVVPGPVGTPSVTPTWVPTGIPTPGPTWTPGPTPSPTMTGAPSPTMTAVPSPTMTPVGDDDDGDDDDNDGDGNNQTGGAAESLSGTVWYDLNGDGVRDPGEPGIPEINVRLIGKRSMIDHTATGPDGSYRFGTIPSVGYAGVEFVLPDGYSCTVSGKGSDASSLDDIVAFAESGVDRQTLNAGFIGNHHPATPAEAYGWVLGTVWSDDDADGLKKGETTGLTGVEVRLLDAGGNLVSSARTGYHDRYFSLYLFGPLPPGEYSVAFTAPDGYAFTSTGGDSHADPVTGATTRFQVGGGETVVRDAGLVPASPVRTPGAGEQESADDDETGGAGDGADDGDDREMVAEPQNPGNGTPVSTNETVDGADREQDDARMVAAGGANEDDSEDNDRDD